jgi:lipoic acid synthetase
VDERLITLRKPGTKPDPAGRKPAWLKVLLPAGDGYGRTKETLRRLDLHTVCEEARCPNVAECWGGGTATIMLLGDTCTRGCRFCNVKTGNPGGIVDREEPRRVGNAIAEMGLRYVVLTTVDRDDLADGGAAHIGETIATIKRANPRILVEALVGDFLGNASGVHAVLDGGPDVYAHNVETVERLTPKVRDRRMTYATSMGTLVEAKRRQPSVVTKSSIMLGLGETEDELLATMRDLLAAGVQVLTLGQYLRPTSWHLPVERWVDPQEFEDWKAEGEAMGFAYVAAGPLVRSSYKAGEYFIQHVLLGRDH